MAMNLKWSQQFQNYLADFENKYKAAQSTLSPLGFALSQKIIPMNQYLKWAQSTYHLPIINEDYFNTHLPSAEDWKSWKTEFQWSEEIVPIGLWDGHLLVACLETPTRFPASFYPIFLLADFKHTQRTFQFYVNSDKGSESAKKVKELINPQPAVAQTPPPAKSQASQVVKIETLELIDASAEESNNDAEELNLNPVEEQPEGLNFSIESLSTNAPSVASLSNSLSTLSSTSTPSAPTEISFDNLDILSNPGKEEISLKFTNVEVTSGSGKKIIKDSNTGITNSGMTNVTSVGNLTTISHTNLPASIQNEINKGLPYFIAIKKDNPINFETITQGFFAKGSNLFNKFILVAVDPSELHAVPVSWSDAINPRSKDLEKLDLNEPSIFKTVASTLKSYHGHIVLNESNEKFFEFWNQGQVPGNITMVPLIVRNKLVGMWMGLGESNTYNWNTLKQMEARGKELCETFSNMFKDSKESAA
tara:strand:+ start:107677 stop:109107 length:1431 start_codon:yes stop_codon:yes gene_type:complete